MKDIRCAAFTFHGKTSFDPFHGVETRDTGNYIALVGLCTEAGEYSVYAYGMDKVTCVSHLSLLVNEAPGDGRVVLVTRLVTR